MIICSLTTIKENIYGGIAASLIFAFCTYFFYWLKWVIASHKFCGIWEQYEFNTDENPYSMCHPDQIRGTQIKRKRLNPKKLKAQSITFESGYYRTWDGNYELLSYNYATGEYIYRPDKSKHQWGIHELRTQKRKDGQYILLTVKDSGSRGFTRSGQLLKKVYKKNNLIKYKSIKCKIKNYGC